MARIIGVEVPPGKRIDIALRYIYGIGPVNAKEILERANIDPSIRAKDLTEAQLSQIVHAIQEGKYVIEGDLRREHGINMDKDRIARLMRELDIRGVTRSKTTVTTRSDRNSPRRGSSPVQCSRCAAPSEGGIPVSVIRFEIVLGKGGVLHRTGIPSDPSARTAWPPK